MISHDYACDLLRQLVSIPSFSGAEQDIASFLRLEMERLGFAAHIDRVGNVIGETGSPDGPLVILLGHIDTVSSLLPVTERDGKLYGRGSVDAKGSFATFVCSAAMASSLPIRLVVIGAVEEESTSRGAKFIRSAYQPAATFVGEPSGAANLVIGYKGQIKGVYTVTRPAGHSAGPTENAAVEVSRFWTELQEHWSKAPSPDRIFDAFSPNIEMLSGDQEFAQLRFDLRTPPHADPRKFLEFTTRFQDRGHLKITETIPAALYSQNSAPARALRRAIREFGLSPSVKVKTGTCDMNTVCSDWDCPIVAYGPGDSTLDHTVEEHIEFEEYQKAIAILHGALGFLATELQGQTSRVSSMDAFNMSQ